MLEKKLKRQESSGSVQEKYTKVAVTNFESEM